jgi:hypothetical protein
MIACTLKSGDVKATIEILDDGTLFRGRVQVEESSACSFSCRNLLTGTFSCYDDALEDAKRLATLQLGARLPLVENLKHCC